MAKKGTRIVVTLECTECRSVPDSEKRSPGVSRYTTEKNRRNTSDNLNTPRKLSERNTRTKGRKERRNEIKERLTRKIEITKERKKNN